MPQPSRQRETASVGLAMAHDSASLHVRGTATYVDDMREPDGLLHVVPGFARDGARGKITSAIVPSGRNQLPIAIGELQTVDTTRP